jgi:photosystem II stability/assembly factor-like uncharacterized protein
MLTFLSRHRYKTILVLAFLTALIVPASLFIDVRDLCAHSPHDPIDALEISPTYDQDEILFIAISDYVLRSTDGGHSWKALVNGLDNKHDLSSIAISPSFHTDKTLFLSSLGDGIYKSQDGGDSWTTLGKGLSDLKISLLSISPNYRSDRTVLAAGTDGGLFRSEDGGDGWHRVIDDGTKITALAFSPDLSGALVVSGDDRGRLYFSDNGEVWQPAGQIPQAGAITVIAISPNFSSDGTFFIGTERGGVFRTVDGGASFVEVNEGLRFTIRGKYGTLRKSKEGPIVRRDEKDIVSIALSPSYESDSTVFVSMWNEAVFKSQDGGSTWGRHAVGLTCDHQADAADYRSPHFRAVRFSSDFEHDETIFLGGFDGLFKSTDGGRHWVQMETLPLRLIKGLAVSPGDISSLSVAITTYGGGACTTDDQGATWAINNSGLKTTRLSDIAFSPSYQTDDLLFSAARGYLLRSTDRGDTWDKIELDYARDWTSSWRRRVSSVLKWVGIPSSLSELILTDLEKKTPFATVLAVSPDYPSDRTMYFGSRYHGLFRSTDDTLDPSIIWDGMGRTITALAISPDFPSDGTLFASLRGAGVYKTIDRGDTWRPANNGLTFLEAWESPTVHDITKKDVLLAISPHYGMDKTVFAACSEGLFRTVDGGESWQELNGAPFGEDAYVIGLAISPDYEHDATLLVSVRGGGLFIAEDGGTTFAEIGTHLIESNYAIEYIAFSPSYAVDHAIYAASDEELFRSSDGGKTWELIARPVRYENMREVVSYEGEWSISNGVDFSAGSVSYSDVAHARAILNFVGTGVSWIGTESNDQGIARVFIDGEFVGEVDQFNETRESLVTSYSLGDLPYGPHTIVIEATGTKNSRSSGYRIEVDAFDIAP